MIPLALAAGLFASGVAAQPYADRADRPIAGRDGSSFALSRVQANDMVVELFAVTARREGLVTIYDYNAGMQGLLLGSEAVTQGSNQELRIALSQRPANNVLAVMTIQGLTVAEQEVELR
jgi:hypothetical protein